MNSASVVAAGAAAALPIRTTAPAICRHGIIVGRALRMPISQRIGIRYTKVFALWQARAQENAIFAPGTTRMRQAGAKSAERAPIAAGRPARVWPGHRRQP